MRIVQIAPGYLKSTLYVKLFEALQKKGVENIIFVPVQNGVMIEKEDVNVYPCFSKIDRILYYPKQEKVIKGIEEVVNLEKTDVVHAHTLFSAGYAALKIKEKYNIPYIVVVRNTDVNVFFKRAPYLKKEGIKVMLNADKVIFLSPAYQHTVIQKYVPSDIREMIYEKSLVIPNGISELFLDNSLNEGRSHIRNIKNIKLIYVGEINQNKNLKETIKAVHILGERGYKVSIIVVGDITDFRCRNLMKEGCVEYHERCGQEQLIRYYREADIFVMPSHTETFGLVYAEAMSQGLPVLYTKGQGFDGYFKDGQVGYAVSDKDAADLADKIELVIRRYNEISVKCIDGAQRFNWDSISEEYCNVYQEITLGIKKYDQK